MRLKLFFISVFSFIFIAILNFNFVYAESVTDKSNEYNNSIGYAKTILKNQVEPPYSVNKSVDEYIDPATGTFNIKQTDINLNGRNGLDFSISRYYSQTDSTLYTPYVSSSANYTRGYNFRGYFLDVTKSVCKCVNGIVLSSASSTTTYCYSSLEAAQAAAAYYNSLLPDTSDEYYDSQHHAYVYDVTEYSTGSPYSIVEEYWYISSYSYNNNLSSSTNNDKYSDLGAGWAFDLPYIEDISGYLYLNYGSAGSWQVDFGSSGGQSHLKDYPLIDMKLNYDSQTYFNGQAYSYYVLEQKDGKKTYFGSDGRLLGIKDRFNNEIKFQHDTSRTGYPIVNKIIDSVGREININYSTSQVIVTINDLTDSANNRTITYNKVAIPGYSNEYVLDNVVDSANRQTKYQYDIKSANVNLLNKSVSSGVTNQYACLSKIISPTAGESIYNYIKITKNCGTDGVMESFKLSERYDSKNDGISYNYRKFNYLYGGTGEFDGYPTYSNEQSIPDSYQFKTQVVDGINNSDVYTYNKKKLPIDILREGSDHKTQTINEYDTSTRLLLKTIQKVFNKTTGLSLQTVENYQYDSSGYRDMIGFWDKQATRDANNMPVDNEHKVTITYQSTYHYPLTKSYKKDATTTISEEFIATSDNKAVQWSNIYENGTLKSKAWYGYDIYGNVIEEKKYLDDWATSISTKYDYSDNESTRNGKFNGVYLTRKWIDNVKNIDEVLANSSGVTVDETYKYDWFGNLLENKDGSGYLTSYTYDKIGRTLQEKHPDNSYKSWSYTTNSTENSVVITDENANQLKYFFDKLGNVEKEQDVTTGQYLNQYTYDNMMRLKTESNQNTSSSYRIIEYNYYSDNSIAEKVTKDQNNTIMDKKSYAYDNANSNGSYIKVSETSLGDTNAPSITAISYINKLGQIEKQGNLHNGAELLSTFKYDYLGHMVEEKSARAYNENWSQPWISKYEYNYAGQLTKTYDINNNVTTKDYDALGRLISTTDPKGNLSNPKYSSSFVYDAVGRLIEEKYPVTSVSGTINYSVKRNYYDKNGNLILQKNSSNKPGETLTFDQTGYEYNNRNMLVKVTTYNGVSPVNYTQYYYDAVGNKIRQYTGLGVPLTITGLDQVTAGSDSSYSVVSYDYNRFGRMTQMKDASGKYETYTLDLNGNLISKTDRNGNITTNTYDGLNRILSSSVTTTDGLGNAGHTYAYTLIGTRKLMDNTTYLYDDLGRLDAEAEGSIVKKYTYDAANNRKSFVLKNSENTIINTTYEYDIMNRLEKVFENNELIATYSYDENGNRQTLTYSNGNNTSYNFNIANQLTTLSNKKSTSVLSQYSYEYYLNGNQAKKSDNIGKVTSYIYDGLSRLVTESDNTGSSISYSYDDNNNRKTMTVSQIDTLITDDSLNTYNGYNQLTSTISGGQNTSYTYNGDGLRTSKTVNGQLTYQVWDGDQIVLELDGSGNVIKKYVCGINLIYLEDGTGTNRRYFLYNGHGDVSQLTDSAGNMVKSYEYDAFGNEKNPDPNDTNVFRYCGEYFDKETGLYYLRARYYDPTIGRFISEDSYWGKNSDPLSLNLYTYCLNNPIMYFDPSGYKPEKLRDMVIACGGSVTWDSNSKAATVNIDGNIKTYTIGEDGAYIKDNRLYVSGEKFAADFGGSYAGATGDGVSGYTLSINVQVYTTGPRGNKLPAGYRHIASVESVTFDNSVAGEKAAGDMNLALQDNANYAEGRLTATVGIMAAGFGGRVVKVIAGVVGMKELSGANFIKAPQVHAGYTYVSVYDGYYTTSGGGGGYRYLIITP